MYQVEDQRYDLLGEWLTADLDRFFLATLDALAMADRPGLPRWQANLLRWEEKWGRTHPYRGRLF